MICNVTRSFNLLRKCQNINITTKCLISSLIKDRALINGEWVTSTDTFNVTNPANGNIITTVPDCGKDETEKAIDHAYDCLLYTSDAADE